MATISLVLTAITQLTPIFVRLIKLYAESRHKGWVNDVRDLATKIDEAKTDEERKQLARALFGTINK
jgi:hypothetical protein